MTIPTDPRDPGLRKILFTLYREFFDKAESKRRWSIRNDIPWDECNPNMLPAIADVVETFCTVEMYLPDYIAKALPMVRQNRGWAWFHANWGYEESKHSLVLSDWLLKSGARTEEEIADLEDRTFEYEYELPEDSPQGMLVYGMVQELATWLHYRNLKLRVDEIGDPALSKILQLVCIDERAHHAFYRRVVQLFLELDRPATLEQLKRVILNFKMPAVHLLSESKHRETQIRELNIFDEDMFTREVYQPILQVLGLTSRDFRRTAPERKSSGRVNPDNVPK